jgi:hypothetical protein
MANDAASAERQIDNARKLAAQMQERIDARNSAATYNTQQAGQNTTKK